jgi:steroid delta-isomerase-like uncharacterized protein
VTQLTEPQVREMIAVVNTRNADKVADQYAEDATFQVPNLEMPAKGKEAIRAIMKGSFTAFPDWTIDIKSVTVSGNETFVVQTVKGTHEGPLTGMDGKIIAPTHKKFVSEQVAHVVLNENGKVKSLHAYGNPADVYRQLGLVSPPK